MTTPKIQALADDLIGTCNDADLEALTVAECKELDELIFCCEGCGWWCGIEDMGEEAMYCDDCRPEQAEEE